MDPVYSQIGFKPLFTKRLVRCSASTRIKGMFPWLLQPPPKCKTWFSEKVSADTNGAVHTFMISLFFVQGRKSGGFICSESRLYLLNCRFLLFFRSIQIGFECCSRNVYICHWQTADISFEKCFVETKIHLSINLLQTSIIFFREATGTDHICN